MGDKKRIILGVLVTPSEVIENQPMLDLLWRARFRWKLHPRQVTGDTTYGTLESIRAVEEAHISASMPLADPGDRNPMLGLSQFRYDPERDVYFCPQGKILAYHYTRYALHLRVYLRRCRHLQCLSTESELYHQRAWAHHSSEPG